MFPVKTKRLFSIKCIITKENSLNIQGKAPPIEAFKGHLKA